MSAVATYLIVIIQILEDAKYKECYNKTSI